MSAAVVLTLLPPSSGLGAHALAERLDAACAVEPANFGGHWWLPQCFPQAQVAFTNLTGKLGDAHPPPPPAWWESRSLWWWLCGLAAGLWLGLVCYKRRSELCSCLRDWLHRRHGRRGQATTGYAKVDSADQDESGRVAAAGPPTLPWARAAVEHHAAAPSATHHNALSPRKPLQPSELSVEVDAVPVVMATRVVTERPV